MKSWYRRYDGAVRCPKCGHGPMAPKFQRRNYDSIGIYAEMDTLRVECGRCGFSETQLPLDTPIDDETKA